SSAVLRFYQARSSGAGGGARGATLVSPDPAAVAAHPRPRPAPPPARRARAAQRQGRRTRADLTESARNKARSRSVCKTTLRTLIASSGTAQEYSNRAVPRRIVADASGRET